MKPKLTDPYKVDPDRDGRPGLSSELIIDTPWERQKFTQERLLEIRKELIEMINSRSKVNWLNYLFGYMAWYQFKKKVKLDLETLYFLLSKFDELKPFMPNKACEALVVIIDEAGEYLYERKRKARGKTK